MMKHRRMSDKNWGRLSVFLLIVFILSITILGYVALRSWWGSQYDSKNFNCLDMSHVLAPRFHTLGFDTKIIHGYDAEGNVSHAWLSLNGVYFDATSLWFDDEDEYERITVVDEYPYGYWDDPIMFNDTVTLVYFGNDFIYVNHTYPLYLENNLTYNVLLTMECGSVVHVEAIRNATGLAMILGDYHERD